MQIDTCPACDATTTPEMRTCESCGLGLSISEGKPVSPVTGPLLIGVGCLAPFALAALSLLWMSITLDGVGGSGLIMVPAFLGGLVIGVPLFIMGIVVTNRRG